VAARIHSGALFACRSTGPSALYGIPAIGNLEVLVQSREFFLMFDALIQSAQNRRAMLLREINNRRSSVRKS
jgi:hypothetical protein